MTKKQMTLMIIIDDYYLIKDVIIFFLFGLQQKDLFFVAFEIDSSEHEETSLF